MSGFPLKLAIFFKNYLFHNVTSIILKKYYFYRFQKYQTSIDDDFAGNYFKPKRATELLIQSHGESGRPFHKWKGIVPI